MRVRDVSRGSGGFPIPSYIRAVPAPPLAKRAGLKQAVYKCFIGSGRLIAQESVDILRSGRKAGEVIGETPDERCAIGIGNRVQLLVFELCKDEAVDIAERPSLVLNSGYG